MRSQTTAGDTEPLAVIILVGGRSSRMGQPKAWLDLAGRSLLARVVERVRPWAHEIVLVAAPGQHVPPLDPEPGPRTLAYDDHPGEGPLPALAVGLAAASVPWALAIGCDTPWVRPALVARLAEERTAAVDAVMPLWDERPQPLVALYRRSLVDTLTALVAAGERRLHAIARLPRVRLVSADVVRALDPEGESFRGINTPAEYAAAVAAWSAPPPSR